MFNKKSANVTTKRIAVTVSASFKSSSFVAVFRVPLLWTIMAMGATATIYTALVRYTLHHDLPYCEKHKMTVALLADGLMVHINREYAFVNVHCSPCAGEGCLRRKMTFAWCSFSAKAATFISCIGRLFKRYITLGNLITTS